MKILSALVLFPLLGAVSFSAAEPQERSTTETFAVEPGGQLKVSLSGGDVSITSWTRNEVLVSAAGRSEWRKEDLTMTKSGNTVEITGDLGLGEEGDLRLKINVPSTFDVDIRTRSGDIEIGGPLRGAVEASTAAGDIRLRALTGEVNVRTAGGDISSENVDGMLNAKTMGGDLRIGSVTGAVDVSTMGGDVAIDRAGREVSVSTAGGDVSVGDAGGSVNISTAGGDIRVTKAGGTVKLNTAGGDITVRSAPGEVRVNTAGGDLQIAEALGPVSASTAGGDVTLSLASGKILKSTVSTAHGDVTVYVQDGTKATIEARITSAGRDSFEIRSDFPMLQTTPEEGYGPQATITVNGGGEVVTIETKEGNISVKRAGAASKNP
jgi:DUF4097 and DUF4098 domain-containing protein YvlB